MMANKDELTSFKRYNKVLGSQVERILRVRRRELPKEQGKQAPTQNLPTEPQLQADVNDQPRVSIKPRRRPSRKLQTQIEVLKLRDSLGTPRRVVSRTSGVTITYYDEYMEIHLDKPGSVEQASQLTQSLRGLANTSTNLKNCSIDLRALNELSNSMVEAIYALHVKLTEQNKTLGLIVDQDKHILSNDRPISVIDIS